MRKFASLIGASAQKQVPWKNGRGVTSEIAVDPAGASLTTMRWRLSAAPVTEPGPFSLFPGYERLLTLLEGKGLHLTSGELGIELNPGMVHRFSGADSVIASLAAGPVKDLGLIFDPKQITAEMHVLRFEGKARSFSISSDTAFFYAMLGSFAASVYPGEKNFALARGDALRIDPVAGREERVVLLQPMAGAAASLVAVEISENRP